MAYAFRLVSLLKCTKIYHGTFAIYEKVPQIFPFYIKSWVTSEDMSLLVQMNRTSLVVPMLLLTDRTHERERLMNFFWIAPIILMFLLQKWLKFQQSNQWRFPHMSKQTAERAETPFLHPALATGVIVLAASVSVCVCLSVLHSRPNGLTYRLEFCHVGQVEEYLGQVWRSRSKVKVTRSNKRFSMRVNHSNADAIRKWLIEMKPA